MSSKPGINIPKGQEETVEKKTVEKSVKAKLSQSPGKQGFNSQMTGDNHTLSITMEKYTYND